MSEKLGPMEKRYIAQVPFRAFFEVGYCPVVPVWRRGSPPAVARLEAMNVPVGSLVMPSHHGVMVGMPGEELMRGMLRVPKPPPPSPRSTSPRQGILLRRWMAHLHGSEPEPRRDWARLQDMAESGFLRELPEPNPRTDLIGYDYEPAMNMVSRMLPHGTQGGVVIIEHSHELTTFKSEIKDLIACLKDSGAEKILFQDIWDDDVFLMRAEFADGSVVVASKPETYRTWIEGPLPDRADLPGCLASLAGRGEMSRDEFLDEMRAGMESRPGLGR